MARARGRDLRAVRAGTIICWAVAGGVSIAQENAEVVEDLGNSYLLARRTTSQGSVIETLLFAGQAIVTEIAVPAPGAVATAGTTGTAAVARTQAGSPNARPGETNLSLDLGPGFGGTLMTGEMVDNYLVLHRMRASGPVTHEIFHDGHKVGFVTEVGQSNGVGRLPGRLSFAFESSDDRFVVHLTQPDGTRIRATTEQGRFSGQVVERAAALATAPRRGLVAPAEPPIETARPSVGRSPETPRLARPQEPAGSTTTGDPAPQIVPALPEPVPLPRPFPMLRLKTAIAAGSVQTAIPSPAVNFRGAQIPENAASAIRAKPRGASPLARADAASPVAPAFAVAAPPARPKLPAASVVARPPAATAIKPAGPAARPKPTLAAEEARPSPGATAKPITPAAKPKRSPPSDTSSP